MPAPVVTAPRFESAVFYAPNRPDEGVKLPSRVDPVRFRAGVLETSDPELIAALRQEVARGLYLEADLDYAITCERCGVKFRNQRAFALHTERHFGQ